MRWPKGPPHLTLKPSKIKQKQKQKLQKTQKKNKKHKKTPQNELFKYQSIFCFFWWVSKISLFWQLGPKSPPPLKIGVSATHFLKTDLRHKTAIFGPQNPKTRNSSYHFLPFFFSFNNKNTKMR